MRIKNIFEALQYFNVFMQYEEFCKLLQTTIIALFLTLQQDVPKIRNLGYIFTLLESPFHAESNGVIFNFVH